MMGLLLTLAVVSAVSGMYVSLAYWPDQLVLGRFGRGNTIACLAIIGMISSVAYLALQHLVS